MSEPIMLSLVVLAVIVIGAYFFFGSKKEQADKNSTNGKNQTMEIVENVTVPEEFEEEYNFGMSPIGAKNCTFYTLTHCVHCVRLENFLEKNEIPFETVLLDNFEGQARKNLMAQVRSFNPRGSFPTLVSPEGDVTVGFREWQVREKFMKYSKLTDSSAIDDTSNTENSSDSDE